MMHLLAVSNFESAVLQRLSCTTLNEIARFWRGKDLGNFLSGTNSVNPLFSQPLEPQSSLYSTYLSADDLVQSRYFVA